MSAITNPGNPKFDNTIISDYTDSRKSKLNNSQAFRAMFEILRNDGDLESPKFDSIIKQLINEDCFYTSVPNGVGLADKLKQFAKAWPQIKNDPKLRAGVSSTISSFHTSWPEYNEAILTYLDNPEFPIYFSVNGFLNDLLDKDGNIKPTAKDNQSAYLNLAIDWRAEINQQYLNRQSARKHDEEAS